MAPKGSLLDQQRNTSDWLSNASNLCPLEPSVLHVHKLPQKIDGGFSDILSVDEPGLPLTILRSPVNMYCYGLACHVAEGDRQASTIIPSSQLASGMQPQPQLQIPNSKSHILHQNTLPGTEEIHLIFCYCTNTHSSCAKAFMFLKV